MTGATILLDQEGAKLWTMMNALKNIGVFDIRFGSATINFDGQGKVSNVKIERNYRVTEFEI